MFSFNRTFELPFKYSIPNSINLHIETVSYLKRYFKYLKRSLFLKLKNQKHLELFKITSIHKKILWINISAPSLGDSLMDLSSRVLLENRYIDLFTDSKNANLYLDDDFFSNIFTSTNDVNENNYDLVIIDSFSTRSVTVKPKVALNLNYVGMFGFFNGPEVNRTLFSFHQLNNLLEYQMSESEILKIAKNYISISKEDKELVRQLIPNNYISIVIGGEWKYKTYDKWLELIKKIIQSNQELNIILIGSINATKASNDLISNLPQCNLYDLVAKLTFNQTAEVIRNSDILICCDGGLMHAANALNTKVVALFAKLNPEILITESCISYNLYDDHTVNNLSVDDVFKKYIEASNNLA